MPVGPAKAQDGSGTAGNGTVLITSAVPPAFNMAAVSFTYAGQTIRLTMSNPGTVNLVIGYCGITGPFTCSRYYLPNPIHPNETAWADMVFTPPGAGNYQGNISIPNSAETTVIPLYGHA